MDAQSTPPLPFLSHPRSMEQAQKGRNHVQLQAIRENCGLAEFDDWVGRQAIWTLSLRRNSATVKVTTLVRIVDSRVSYGRTDLLVQTNTGSTAWVTPDSLRLVPKEMM